MHRRAHAWLYFAKYTVDRLDIPNDDCELLGSPRMERWLDDRHDLLGEFVRQRFKGF